jgi:hypothetical protein
MNSLQPLRVLPAHAGHMVLSRYLGTTTTADGTTSAAACFTFLTESLRNNGTWWACT